MAEDHQPALTLRDAYRDLRPNEIIVCPGFNKEDKSALGRSLKHYKNVLSTLL